MHQRIGYNILCNQKKSHRGGPQLTSWIEQLIHHYAEGSVSRELKGTYRFLCNLSNVVGNSDALWMFFEKLLGRRGIDIVDEECVFSRYLRSKVPRHGIAWQKY